MYCLERSAPKKFLLSTVAIIIFMPSLALAQGVQNPWDFESETSTNPAPVPPITDSGVRERAVKSWTEMNYAELLAEIERPDSTYSPYTKKQMRNRLVQLESLNPVAAATEESQNPNTIDQSAVMVVPPIAAGQEIGATNGNAMPMVVVPVTPPMATSATPWWKLPKDQQAAAKEAQEKQRQQAKQDAAAAATGATQAVGQQQEKKETARDRIYKQIQKNRGF